MSGHWLDLDTWPRRKHFDFFRSFAHPYFNLCTDIEVTETLERCRRKNDSFARAAWFLCQVAANRVEPFRYRLRGDLVWVHDHIKIGTTRANEDGTFRFGYYPYAPTYADFVESPPDDIMDGRPEDDAMIHGSTVPWVRFTSVSHAHQGGGHVSPPRVVYGKYFEEGSTCRMPVSVEVHHALMDGVHVAQFLTTLEAAFAEPALLSG